MRRSGLSWRERFAPQLRAYCLAWAWMCQGRHHPLATPAERAELERLHPPKDTQADGAK